MCDHRIDLICNIGLSLAPIHKTNTKVLTKINKNQPQQQQPNKLKLSAIEKKTANVPQACEKPFLGKQ